jgi:hypothetical protein
MFQKISPDHSDVLGNSGAVCMRFFEADGVRIFRAVNPSVSLKGFRPNLREGYCVALALQSQGSRQLFRFGSMVYSVPSERGSIDVFEVDDHTDLYLRPPFDYVFIEISVNFPHS